MCITFMQFSRVSYLMILTLPKQFLRLEPFSWIAPHKYALVFLFVFIFLLSHNQIINIIIISFLKMKSLLTMHFITILTSTLIRFLSLLYSTDTNRTNILRPIFILIMGICCSFCFCDIPNRLFIFISIGAFLKSIPHNWYFFIFKPLNYKFRI